MVNGRERVIQLCNNIYRRIAWNNRKVNVWFRLSNPLRVQIRRTCILGQFIHQLCKLGCPLDDFNRHVFRSKHKDISGLHQQLYVNSTGGSSKDTRIRKDINLDNLDQPGMLSFPYLYVSHIRIVSMSYIQARPWFEPPNLYVEQPTAHMIIPSTNH